MMKLHHTKCSAAISALILTAWVKPEKERIIDIVIRNVDDIVSEKLVLQDG